MLADAMRLIVFGFFLTLAGCETALRRGTLPLLISSDGVVEPPLLDILHKDHYRVVSISDRKSATLRFPATPKAVELPLNHWVDVPGVPRARLVWADSEIMHALVEFQVLVPSGISYVDYDK